LAVREIQVLQAPHIAEKDDAAMTRLESDMRRLGKDAHAALGELGRLVAPSVQSDFAAAGAALDRFDRFGVEIVSLSRRNTNVRSLDLALRVKPPLTAACDASLRELTQALADEGGKSTR